MLESQKPQTAKILIKVAGRLFLADPKDVCYATIDDGVITVTPAATSAWKGSRTAGRWKSFLRTSIPTCSGGRTGRFWSTRITSARLCPGSKSSYQLRMDDKKQTEIPVSRAQTRRLRELFNL